MRKTYRCWECPTLFLSGSWHFTDEEAASFVVDISEHYQQLFRTPEPPFVQIAIAKYPVRTEPGAWDAETRGRSVTIISSDMPFRTQSLQRLHEQLRHELFHLWIPNRVNLTGNYDWFYEGFALYQSLKLAVRLNRIRFEDFLDTLSRAHTIDSAGSQRISLIRASASRFSGSNTQIYARGMLVAFLTDVAMLQKSRGKSSVDDLLKDLFLKHRKPAAPADGNATVIALMKENTELVRIVDSYVTGVDKIEWTSDLAAAGIEDIDPGPITNLRVKEKLGGRQKTLLDKLGYNNWRKLSRNSR
jgi:predicted metalloprotease with PDZ domain